MHASGLRLRPLGIDTQQEHAVYMRRDCHVCQAEGFQARTRLEVSLRERRIIATLNVVDSDLLEFGIELRALVLRRRSYGQCSARRTGTFLAWVLRTPGFREGAVAGI